MRQFHVSVIVMEDEDEERAEWDWLKKKK